MNYIFYHSNCMDGLCAGWVTWNALINKFNTPQEDIAVEAVHYQNPLPDFDYQKEDTVYIVDFSYPRDVLVALAEKCNVVVLDHHDSAEKQLADLPFAYFDMDKSGAGMAWGYFYPEYPVPLVVQMVQDRDLWKFEVSDTKAFSTALQDDPRRHDFDFWTKLVAEDPAIFPSLMEKGHMLLDQLDGILKNFIEKKKYKIVTRNGYQVALFNTTSLFSEMGEYAYQQLPIDFSMSYFIGNDGRVIFSLRSPRGGVNVGEIATALGGGGHINAAGFSFDICQGGEFLMQLYSS